MDSVLRLIPTPYNVAVSRAAARWLQPSMSSSAAPGVRRPRLQAVAVSTWRPPACSIVPRRASRVERGLLVDEACEQVGARWEGQAAQGPMCLEIPGCG